MLSHGGVRIGALLLAGTSLLVSHAHAIQLNVPADFPTIQAAINAASTGDVVMVAPGTYSEQLNLMGKEFTLRGSGAATTILDGAGLGRTLMLVTFGETTATVVEGFTFANGEGQLLANCVTNSSVAGAIYMRFSGLTIRDCRFHRNGYDTRVAIGGAVLLMGGSMFHAERCTFNENGVGAGSQTAFGGGIMCCSGVVDLSLNNCTFTGNTASHGGGVFSSGNPLTVTDSTFTGNTASHGGGIRADVRGGLSQIRVTGCRFTQNAASFGGGVNATATVGSSSDDTGVFIDDCDFTDNDAGFGGGLFSSAVVSSSQPVVLPPRIHVTNSRFIGNVASAECCNTGIIWTYCFQDGVTWGTYFGGGADLRDQNGAEIRVVNCLFANNTGVNAGGLHVATCAESSFGYPGGHVEITNVTAVGNSPNGLHLRVGEKGDIKVRNSIVRGNSSDQIIALFNNPVAGSASIAVNHSNVEGGFAGVGIIDAPPLFANVGAGDYRLSSGSPSIDAGDNVAVPAGIALDLAGESRFLDDPLAADTGIGPAPVVDMGAYEFRRSVCTADFNNSGAVTVQDIFDFLAAYFGNSPAADVNSSGAVTVQDIFDFLSAYFTGCP